MTNQRIAKRVEKWLVRLIIIQFICLVIAQIIMQNHTWAPYVNKAIKDEGVVKDSSQTPVETMVQQSPLWYDNK